MLENVYEGLNARPKVYLSKEYFCEMYSTCVSSKSFAGLFITRPSKMEVYRQQPLVRRLWIWKNNLSARPTPRGLTGPSDIGPVGDPIRPYRTGLGSFLFRIFFGNSSILVISRGFPN